MNRLQECQEYIAKWYRGEMLQTIMMDGGDSMNEYCIQCMVVELLRDFIDNPIPEGLMEGTAEFNSWIDVAFRKVMRGMNFGFNIQQEDAVKNLAFNYYAVGIRKTQSEPSLKPRLMKVQKQHREKTH